MIGVYVSVPVACWRKGLAREFLETEIIPPPATCYGFLLSLVGETDRRRHIGARITPAVISRDRDVSVILRTVWRVKKVPLGSPGNTRPDYQQLLTNIRLVIWLDSAEETREGQRLEQRVHIALDPAGRRSVHRFGGLSLGESTHLVDEVCRFEPDPETRGDTFLLSEQGRLTLPVWVDHVGSVGTRHVVGNIAQEPSIAPAADKMPRILPPDNEA